MRINQCEDSIIRFTTSLGQLYQTQNIQDWSGLVSAKYIFFISGGIVANGGKMNEKQYKTIEERATRSA